jgi:hypothetical protein
MKIEHLFINAIKNFAIESGDYSLTAEMAQRVSLKVFNRVLFIFEQMGFHEIKERQIAEISIKSLLTRLTRLPLSKQENEQITEVLLNEIYAKSEE